LALKDST